MFVTLLAVVLAGASGRELAEPKFRVLTPDELMVEVPHHEDMVTFRIGVRRKFNEQEDLELGENVITTDRIYIYDERLDLKRDDVVNYLLVFRNKDGYQPQTGKYTFDGVYLKRPFGRRQRFRRDASTTEKPELDQETETVDPAHSIESRFGGHHHHRHHDNHYWPGPDGGFNPFRPPGFGPPGRNPPPPGFGPSGRGPPNFGPGRGPPNYPFPGYGPNSGGDCDDHSHDKCHQVEPAKWERSTKKPVVQTTEYHCRMCQKVEPGRSRVSSTPNSVSSSDYPDIDVRFSDD